ncbi:MAG: NAD(P)/FAD-dependent oxidoreductase [Euryarchaeota archaeon]|nr:NAD(P)/FAD-dependent oxidoreductase [Euryarchaeota archaeon]
MRRKCDVLVVGAGPGGSTVARYASQAGADVLLIEKRQEVGSPVRCGEGISAEWIEKYDIHPDPSWTRNKVDGARVFSPNGTMFTVNAENAGDEVGYVIERDAFDRMLAERAVRAGAELKLKTAALGIVKKDGKVVGVKAECMGERFDIEAPIVVGADGYESQVGRWAGIDTTMDPKDVQSCLQYRMVGLELTGNFVDFYLGSKVVPGGYIWSFPKGKDEANVGIGLQVSMVKEPGDAKKYLDKFIAAHPNIAKGQTVEMVAGAVSVCAPIDRTVADGVMLVGDAARQIDPLTGGGIANSVKAGKVAGEVAAQAIEAKDYSAGFFQRYEKGWRAIFENKLYRDYMAKEKLLTLSDETLDKLVGALAEGQLTKVSTLSVLQAIKRKYPELVKEFESML